MPRAQLKLSLLGGFDLRFISGQRIPLAAAKSKALLAYLALRAPLLETRDRLCDLLWTDSPRQQARVNLRQALSKLRKATGPSADLLVSEGEAVGIRQGKCPIDVQIFEEHAASNQPGAWEQAATLYRSDLLEGLDSTAPAFDEWLLVERRRLHETALSVLRKLLDHQRQEERVDDAIRTARRLLVLDNLQEDVYRVLIELHFRAGRRKTALAEHQRLVAVLREELNVSPDEETRRLYVSLFEEGGGPQAAPDGSRDLARRAIASLTNAAAMAHTRGAHRDAAEIYAQTLALQLDLDDDVAAELDLRLALQREYYAVGDMERALDQLERAERRARAFSDAARLTRIYCDLAQIFRARGDMERATGAARRASGLAGMLDSSELRALAGLRLATLHFSSGQYMRALPLLFRVLEILEAHGLRWVDDGEPGDPTVRTRSWLTWCCAELGKFGDGVVYGSRGIKNADELGEMYARVHARIALGVLYLRWRKYAESMRLLSDALELARWAELPVMEPFIRVPLGLCHALAGETQTSLELVQNHHEWPARAIMDATLADVYRLAGDMVRARTLADRAVTSATKSQQVGDLAWSMRAVGNLAREGDRIDDAKRPLQEALRLAKKLGMRPLADLCTYELRVLPG